MANNLSPGAEKRWQQDLLATLGRIEKLEAEKSETSKMLRDVIAEEWSRVKTLRDLLEGRLSEQAALPGLEDDGKERHRRIGAVLRRAFATAEQITGVPVDPRDAAADALDEARNGPRHR